jgi:hypothetical protein
MIDDVDPTVGLVAGTYMDRSLADFTRACAVHLEEEQRKPNPDTALIAVLCDAVRCAREVSLVTVTGGWGAELLQALQGYLDGLVITSATIGDIRRRLLLPFDCAWNGIVRDQTAAREREAAE